MLPAFFEVAENDEAERTRIRRVLLVHRKYMAEQIAFCPLRSTAYARESFYSTIIRIFKIIETFCFLLMYFLDMFLIRNKRKRLLQAIWSLKIHISVPLHHMLLPIMLCVPRKFTPFAPITSYVLKDTNVHVNFYSE